MASIRLTKQIRLDLIAAFQQNLYKEIAATNDEASLKEQGHDCFMAVRDWVLGKDKKVFEALPTTRRLVAVADYVSINFDESPLERFRPEKCFGQEARMYRQSYFTLNAREKVSIPQKMEACLAVEEMPTKLTKQVTDYIVAICKVQIGVEQATDKFRQMINSASTVNSLKQKWPGVDKYLPENINEGPKAIGVTATEIEASIAKLMKAAA